MTDNQRPPMTAPRAAELLADILKWKLQVEPPSPTVSSTPTDTDGIRADNRDALPFGLAQVLDTSWSDGPSGTTSEEGVEKWLRFWVPWFSYWSGEKPKLRMKPGTWMLRGLVEAPEFATIPEWDKDDVEAWREFTSELLGMWWRLGHLTGNAPETRALCPKCKKGSLRSEFLPWRADGSGGLEDTATCSHCKTTIDYSAEEHLASTRAALRADDVPDTLLFTLKEILVVWPRLKPNTLHKWVRDGKIRKEGKRYRLSDVNARMMRYDHPLSGRLVRSKSADA